MNWKYLFSGFVVLIALMVLSPMTLYASNGGFDWGSLGVDVVVVGVIITIVQMIKTILPPKLIAWLPLVLAMIFSGVYGGLTNQGSTQLILKMAFTYAAAAAWLYELGKTVGLKLLKGKRELTE